MLVQSISTQNLNTIRMNRIQHNSETKNEEIQSQNTNSTVLPSYSAAISSVNISFKGLDFSPLGEAIFYSDKKKFDKLIYDSNTNVNEIGCGYHGEYPIELACDNIGQKEPYYLEMLLQRPDLDLYPKDWNPLVQLLHLSHRENFKRYFEVILKHPHVKTEGFLEYAKKYNSLYHFRNDEIPYFSTITTMVKEYEYGVDRREHLIIFNPVIDAHRVLSLDEVWTPKEKTEIGKLIDKKDYDKLALIYTEKGFSLAEEARKVPELKQKTIQEVRESETAKIRQEEQKKAENALEKREQKLETAKANLDTREQNLRNAEDNLKTEKSKLNETIKDKTEKAVKKEKEALEKQKNDLTQQLEAVQKKEATFNSLIEKSQSLIDQGIEDAKDGLRALYNIKTEELPKNMDFEEQKIWVLNVLIQRQDKLTNHDNNVPVLITKAIQDDNGNVSLDGLAFLEKVIDASKEKCSEKDLIEAITSVKGQFGFFDLKKIAFFVTNLAWGNNTIKSVAEMTKNYVTKVQ